MIRISNLILNISDGSTVASTGIYGTASAPKQTYIDIGSGNVFKLHWQTPLLTNDAVDYYSLVIRQHDTAINAYYDIFNKNIGLVNEFYVDSNLLPTVPEQYMLSIYLVCSGKYGNIITSNVINPYVSKGSGIYEKVEDGYTQPIMKRAIAFTRVAQPNKIELLDLEGRILKDIENRALFAIDPSLLQVESALADSEGEALEDAEGNVLFAEVTKVLESVNGWSVATEGYTKDTTGNWRINNIKYEVLVDQNGTIITDSANEPIYVL